MINYNELRDKLLRLDEKIHNKDPYRFAHIKESVTYARSILNMILDMDFNNRRMETLSKIECAAAGHDILKEKHFNPNDGDKIIDGYVIPQDLSAYIQKNMDVVEKFRIGRYINSAIQKHAIASAIFIHNNFGIDDPMIIYPILFHSCPILPIYQTLDHIIQQMIDVMVLADKLSASVVKPIYNKKTGIDLKSILYGHNNCEFNFSSALLMARLIGHNNSNDAHSVMMTEFYHERVLRVNPLILPDGKLPIIKDGKIQKPSAKKNKKGTQKKSSKKKSQKGKKKDVKKKDGKKDN